MIATNSNVMLCVKPGHIGLVISVLWFLLVSCHTEGKGQVVRPFSPVRVDEIETCEPMHTLTRDLVFQKAAVTICHAFIIPVHSAEHSIIQRGTKTVASGEPAISHSPLRSRSYESD